jgi:hypothetical protein
MSTEELKTVSAATGQTQPEQTSSELDYKELLDKKAHEARNPPKSPPPKEVHPIVEKG